LSSNRQWRTLSLRLFHWLCCHWGFLLSCLLFLGLVAHESGIEVVLVNLREPSFLLFFLLPLPLLGLFFAFLLLLLGLQLLLLHGFDVELFNVSHHLGIRLLQLPSDVVDFLEEVLELGEHFEELADRCDSELLPLSIPLECFVYEFESDILENSINESVLDDCPEELGDHV